MNSATWWLFFNLFSIIVLAYFSMMEMACVSFNKVRLQYYVSKGNQRAIWINYLLHNSSRLFGTTLIGVNLALVIGSECSRQFHEALGIDPAWAPFSQVILVVIFGELAPMFAARHYAENVAIRGAPLIYFSAKVLTPFIWIIEKITSALKYFTKGSDANSELYLSREELLKILEEQDEERIHASENEEFNAITTNIFSLNSKIAKQIMQPLEQIPRIPTTGTIKEMRRLLRNTTYDYLLVWHRSQDHIVGIAYARDMLKISNTRKVRDYIRPSWFVTQNTKAMDILKQFRSNKQNVAIILDQLGKAVGAINLNNLMEEIFGKPLKEENLKQATAKFMIDKTFPGNMKIKEFNDKYNVSLAPESQELTFSELIKLELGHHPNVGETIFFGPFELTVEEVSFLEIKAVSITTHFT